MSHVFISYSRKDLEIAERIINALASDHFEPWIDWKNIPKGEEFWNEIQRGIERADVFLFLISPDAAQSDWCNREIVHALKNGKRILPVVVQDTDRQLVPAAIVRLNWVFCRAPQDDFDGSIKAIKETIQTDYDWVRQHTNLQLKALEWEKGKDQHRLMRGRDLNHAESLMRLEEAKDPRFTKLQYEFVTTSRRIEDRTHRRNRLLGAIVIVLIIVAVGIATYAQTNARNEARNARASKLASIALEQSVDNPALSLLLSVEAYHLFDNYNSRNALLGSINESSHIRTYLQTPASVNHMAVSNDGNFLVTASCVNEQLGCRLILWDISGSSVVEKRSIHNDMPIQDMRFTGDDVYVVFADQEKIRYWDLETNFVIQRDLLSPNSIVGIGRDGYQYVETAFTQFDGVDNTNLRIHINQSGIWTYIDIGGKRKVSSDDWMALLSDQNIVRTAFSEQDENGNPTYDQDENGNNIVYPVNFLNSTTGEERAVQGNYMSRIEQYAISPDEKILATGGCGSSGSGGCMGYHIVLWDVNTQQTLANQPPDWYSQPEKQGVTAMAFSADNALLAYGGFDKKVSFIDVASGADLGFQINLRSPAMSIVFTPDGNYVILGLENGEVVLVDLLSGHRLATILSQHNGNIETLEINKTGNVLGIGLYDVDSVNRLEYKNFLLVEADTGNLIMDIDQSSYQVLNPETFGDVLILRKQCGDNQDPDCNANVLGMWDIVENIPAGTLRIENGGNIYAAALNPDRTDLATVDDTGVMIVWDVATGKPIFEQHLKSTVINGWQYIPFELGYTNHYLFAARNAYDSYQSAGAIDFLNTEGLYVWNAEYEQLPNDEVNISTKLFLSASAADKLALVQFDNGVIHLMPLNKNSDGRTYQSPEGFQDVPGGAISDDGQLLAVYNRNAIMFGDLNDNGLYATSLKWKPPFGNQSMNDFSAWTIEFHNRGLQPLYRSAFAPTNVTFSVQGDYLFSGDLAGSIIKWDINPDRWAAVACDMAGRNLTQEEWSTFFPGEAYQLTCPQWLPRE